MAELKNRIKEGMTEREIALAAEDIMRSMGIDRFWYHGIGAFVHVGKRTVISESGRGYSPSDAVVGRNDIITVDLSPQSNDYWGDYSRTLLVIDGKIADEHAAVEASNHLAREFLEGIRIEKELHASFVDYVEPDRTFEDVFHHLNQVIYLSGYANLDFSGNLGHSIEFDMDQRKYFETGNTVKLKDVSYFTFEPHIKRKEGAYGFKREDIYYFDNGKLSVL